MKTIKNFFTSSVMARLATSVLMFVALLNQPLGYYKFLRWVVFSTAIYSAFISYIKNKKINFGVWLFGMIAILFNPIIPFYLGKGSWQTTDLVVGIIFCVSIFFNSEDKFSE